MATETKDSLEDQIARLTAGADDTPVEEGVERTPGQFIHWFLGLAEDKRLEVVESIHQNARESGACFVEDHRGRLEWLEEQVLVGRWLIAEARWVASCQEESVNSVAGQLEQLASRGDSA